VALIAVVLIVATKGRLAFENSSLLEV
jgi:hypothetical protein